jgi:O-antigen/teichoic acid export membrane protein
LKRKFITNLAFLLSLNLLIKPLYAFGIEVTVQNTVGATEYGSFFILLNFTIIFQIILDLGIENFSRREIARYDHLLNKYFSRIFPVKCLLGLLYFTLCAIIGYFMGWHGSEYMLLLLLLINQFLASFILYLRANLGGMHMFRADSIVSVTDRFIVIIICGLLLLNATTRSHFRIEWLVYAQTLAYFISAALAFTIVYMKSRPIQFNFNYKYYLLIFRNSLPFAILILLMATYTRIDSVLLGKMLVNGKEQAGIYAQSFRIIEILSNYGYLFTIILLPIFSKMIKNKEPVINLTVLSFTLLLIPAIILAVGCFEYKREIMSLLYKEHVDTSVKVFGILIFCFPGLCITYIFGTLLTANGSLWQLIRMAGIAVVINLTLNLIFIRKFGVYGAAASNLATQLFTSAYQIALARHIFKFGTNYAYIAKLILFVLLIYTAVFLIRFMGIEWYYTFGIYLVTAFILSFATGIISLKSVFAFAHSAQSSTQR